MSFGPNPLLLCILKSALVVDTLFTFSEASASYSNHSSNWGSEGWDLGETPHNRERQSLETASQEEEESAGSESDTE